MYATMVFLGFIAYLIYLKFAVIKFGKRSRYTGNRLVLVSILGFVALGFSALVMNSVFHTIESCELRVGGITWLGGVIGVIPAATVLIHYLVPKEKGNEINCFSEMMPGLVLAHALGRVGCFLGGCCYGAPMSELPEWLSWLGVSFPEGSSASQVYPAPGGGSVPVLPTQLIEAVFELLLFAVMLILFKKCKNYNIEIYCIAYGIFRFTLEFFRGDDRGATGLPLTPSQFMSIIIWVYAVLLILYRNGKAFKKHRAKSDIWLEEAKAYEEGQGRIIFGSAARTTDSIRELHKLMEEGIISKEEFEAKKAELLKRL